MVHSFHDVKPIFDRILNAVEEEARRKDIVLSIVMGPGIPRCAFQEKDLFSDLRALVQARLQKIKPGGRIVLQALRHEKGRSLVEESREAGIVWEFDRADFSKPGVVIAVSDTGKAMQRTDSLIHVSQNPYILASRTGSGCSVGFLLPTRVERAEADTMQKNYV